MLMVLSSACLIGCAAQQPLAIFASLPTFATRPGSFDHLQDSHGEVAAKISLRAPGLRGSATGIVRHAKNDQYLIELYGRGELFLKVYFTGSQTVLWPSVGMPTVFPADSTPSLRASVHRRLPNWRLDDVLPVPSLKDTEGASVQWAGVEGREVHERIQRQDFDPLYKSYAKPSNNLTFPYRKIILQTETGSSRLVWSLRQTN